MNLNNDQFEALCKVEKQSKELLKKQKITVINIPFYMNFAREIYNIKENSEEKNKTYLLIQLFSKWLMRNLDLDILLKLMLLQDVTLIFMVKM